MIASYLLSTAAVVLAEMGDKTQLLAMAFAARYRWQTVMWAVLAATLANHLLAVVAGNAVTGFLPMPWIKFSAAASFILFALWTVRGDRLEGEDRERSMSPFRTVAIAFFMAEMGDKTQLMTVAIAAEEAVRIGGTGLAAKAAQMVPVWMGTTTGMMIADAFGIGVGVVLHRHLPERSMKWIAAACFAGFGILGMHDSLDELLPRGYTLHHPFLVSAVFVVPALMWLVNSLSAGKAAARRPGL